MRECSSASSVYCIIAAEFCERFSFCGLRTILSLYLRNVLCLHENAATVVYHVFIMVCYSMPLVGAVVADNCIGRYNAILYFSTLYLCGTFLMCCAVVPSLMLPATPTSMAGLALIAAGTGGIKPCVAAFGGDQFRLPQENESLQRFFSLFYSAVNLGGCLGMIATPALRRAAASALGDTAGYCASFGLAAVLVMLSILIFVCGKPQYRIKKPRSNVTLKFVSCAWYAIRRRMQYDRHRSGPPPEHWLDHSADKYGRKLVEDMKVVCAILYLYLPVPIFWSLFDQQGSRWTFQASRLRGEVAGVSVLPDQLQVLNPALVLLLMPACPLMPALPPLTKMFVGGTLAAMAFVCAAMLQVAIERSTLQPPQSHESGIMFLNTLSCGARVWAGAGSVVGGGEDESAGVGTAPVEARGTSLLAPLLPGELALSVHCARDCAGRDMRVRHVREQIQAVPGMFMPVVIGQNSDDELSLYALEPTTFSKSLTGKPKLKVVYIGDTGPNKNVSIIVETENQVSDVFYVSNTPVDHIGESAYMCLQPGRFKWRAESAPGGEVWGWGWGVGRAGGVYVLSARERRGRLDAAVLHAPNPPNELRLAWILPQYVLVSLAEIMFAVSGLEFSFTQAPRSMKTITIAAWYVSVAIGNFIVILVTQTKLFHSRSTEFFVYASVLFGAMVLFQRMSRGFRAREGDADASSADSVPLLHYRNTVISMRSLSSSLSQASYSDVSARSFGAASHLAR